MAAAELLSKTKTAPGWDLQLYNRDLLKNPSALHNINTPPLEIGGVFLLILSTDSDFIKPVG